MTYQQTQLVASVQYAPKLFDVFANLAVAQQLVFEALAKGARVVVLPELCLSGYVLRDKREAVSCAQQKNGYQTEAFIPLCEKFNAHVVFGYVELDEGKLYNSAAVVGPRGIEGNAQKHNLHNSEHGWGTASEQLSPVIVTGAGRLGVLICKDAMNKYRESYQFKKPGQQFYRKGSVDTIALLTNWGNSNGFPDSSWFNLVEETNANVIVSNRFGKERDVKFKGGACVIDRTQHVYTYGSSFSDNAIVGGAVLL